MNTENFMIFALYLKVSVSTETAPEKRVTVRIKLDNTFQREFFENIEKTIVALPTVRAINITSMKSHIMVETAPGRITAEQLIAAVETIRGEDWQCTATLTRTGKSETILPREKIARTDKTNRISHPQRQGHPREGAGLRKAVSA